MKSFLFSIFAILLFVAFTNVSDAQSKEFKGKVVSINKIVVGQEAGIDKAKATTLFEKSQPLGLMVGTGKKAKLYLVYNSDGSYAGKKMAELADGEVVVKGKTKTVQGLQIIISDGISQAK